MATAASRGRSFDAFEFTLTDAATGLTSLVARIDLFFAFVVDPCALVGRPPGCMGS